jgi:hypothetical protein
VQILYEILCNIVVAFCGSCIYTIQPQTKKNNNKKTLLSAYLSICTTWDINIIGIIDITGIQLEHLLYIDALF